MLKKSFLLLFILLINNNLGFSYQVSSYNLEVGQVFINTTTASTNTSVSVNGQLMDSGQESTSVDQYEVIEVNGDMFTLSAMNISTRVDANSMMGSQTIDSEGDTPTDLSLKVITGKTYTFTMNKFGHLLSVSGLLEVIDLIKSELEGTPLEANSDQLSAAFTEENVISTLENKFWIYPETESDSWNQSRSTSMNNMPAELNATYLRVSDNELSVSSDVTIAGDVIQMGMTMKMDVTGTSTGTYTLGSGTGMVMQVVGSLKMNGTINTQGMELPIAIFSDTNSKMEMR